MEGDHHYFRIGFNDAAAAGLIGMEGKNREQATCGALDTASKRAVQITRHGVIGMDKQSVCTVKERQVGQQNAGRSQ